MPELPEVEIAARTLRNWLDGHTIEGAEAEDTRIFRGSDREAFTSELIGKRLEWIERRGKYLLLAFTGNVGLLSHLGMTGKWVMRSRSEPPPRHVRARLLLAGDGIVSYRDPRLFGRISLHPADELFQLKEIASLGRDPLVDGIDPLRLYERMQRTTRPVKVALMDQAVLAGIGNIQATDALFRARIHPSRQGKSLRLEEVRDIASALLDSIAFTLEAEGEGEIAYIEEPGTPNPFLVYGRDGSPCPNCGHPLEKITLGGRTTVFCPVCQKEA